MYSKWHRLQEDKTNPHGREFTPKGVLFKREREAVGLELRTCSIIYLHQNPLFTLTTLTLKGTYFAHLTMLLKKENYRGFLFSCSTITRKIFSQIYRSM